MIVNWLTARNSLLAGFSKSTSRSVVTAARRHHRPRRRLERRTAGARESPGGPRSATAKWPVIASSQTRCTASAGSSGLMRATASPQPLRSAPHPTKSCAQRRALRPPARHRGRVSSHASRSHSSAGCSTSASSLAGDPVIDVAAASLSARRSDHLFGIMGIGNPDLAGDELGKERRFDSCMARVLISARHCMPKQLEEAAQLSLQVASHVAWPATTGLAFRRRIDNLG